MSAVIHWARGVASNHRPLSTPPRHFAIATVQAIEALLPPATPTGECETCGRPIGPSIRERFKWEDAAASTWNCNRAAIGSWLTWCERTKRWSAPALPGDCERRAEHADNTQNLPKRAIERGGRHTSCVSR